MENNPLNNLVDMDESKLEEFFSKRADFLDSLVIGRSDSGPGWFYRFVINFLTSLDFNENEAKRHYFNILEHKYVLSEKLQRDISLRVAALDYFLHIQKILKNPKIVEISLFEQILSMSKEDPKTGCFNFNFFKEAINREIRRAERYEQTLSIILIDIDNFKLLNDNYGHLFGDKILKKFATIIKDNIRAEDIVARYGGDEFIIMLPQTGRIGARSMAERLKYKLIEYFADKKYLDKDIKVTFSAGISTYPFDAKDFEKLLECADRALYKSKYLGKNRIYDYLEDEYMKSNLERKERRQFTRYKLANDNFIYINDENNVINIVGKIVNISIGGVLLECKCSINEKAIGENVKIKIEKLGEAMLENLSFSGSIVRVNKESPYFKFFLALKFDELLDTSRWKVLEQYGKLLPE